MAASLRKLVQQDRAAGLAQKKRKVRADQKQNSPPRPVKYAAATKTTNSSTAGDVRAARDALEVDSREGAPDRIYILHQYPANAEEAQALLSTGVDGLLDCVVELACVQESRAASRAAKNSLALATVDLSARGKSPDGTGTPASQQGEEGAIVKQKARHRLSADDLAEKCAKLAAVDPADPKGTCSRSSSRASFRAAMVAHELLSTPVATSHDSVVAMLKKAADGAVGPGWADVAFLSVVADISGGGPSAGRVRPKGAVVQARLIGAVVCGYIFNVPVFCVY